MYLRENQLENAEDSLKLASEFVRDFDREAQWHLAASLIVVALYVAVSLFSTVSTPIGMTLKSG